MAYTEEQVDPLPPLPWGQRVEQAVGVDDRLTWRLLASLVVLAGAVALAPLPVNVAGAVALVMLVLELARLLWRKR